jgi:hypothetical protein
VFLNLLVIFGAVGLAVGLTLQRRLSVASVI